MTNPQAQYHRSHSKVIEASLLPMFFILRFDDEPFHQRLFGLVETLKSVTPPPKNRSLTSP